MKPFQSKQKKLLRIVLIAAIVLALATIAIYVLVAAPRKAPEPQAPNIPEQESVTEKPKVPKVSMVWDKETENSQLLKSLYMEEERFEKVLQQASDEELLIVLKYAIIHHHVPNSWHIDPYLDVNAGVGDWHRSLLVYDKLKGRQDLLHQIYPDLKVLDDYITINTLVRPFTDTIAAQTILHNAQKDNGLDVDSLMNAGGRRSSLEYKYFGTPLLR